MTSLPPHDPLTTLWQSAPKPDTQYLLQDLQRLNRLHQRLYRIVFAIMCSVALLLIFEEATGRFTTHGTLSVIWTLGLVLGVVWHRRARCSRSDAMALDTVRLLKFMIARAKKDLRIARCLYAGAPCVAVAGFIITKFTGIGTSPETTSASPHLQLVQKSASLAILIAMIVTGLILARARHRQVKDLSEKLRSIEAD